VANKPPGSYGISNILLGYSMEFFAPRLALAAPRLGCLDIRRHICADYTKYYWSIIWNYGPCWRRVVKSISTMRDCRQN
jgi:hypothetical protein